MGTVEELPSDSLAEGTIDFRIARPQVRMGHWACYGRSLRPQEVLACFRLRGGVSGKLRRDSSAKHCALLSVFGSRSIVFVLLSPGRIPSELLVVSAAGGLSVRGVQKSSVTCQLVPLVIS